jgi:hypothetical protein
LLCQFVLVGLRQCSFLLQLVELRLRIDLALFTGSAKPKKIRDRAPTSTGTCTMMSPVTTTVPHP